MRMANEIKLLFLPGKDKEPWRIPCDFQIRETEISVFRILPSSHLSLFLRFVLCFSRFVPCGVLEGHRRIISPWSGRIGGGLHVGCSLSRCIQMINYKYRSELGGCAREEETDGAKGRWKIIRVTLRAKSEFTNEMCHCTDAGAAGWSQPWFRASLIECSTLPLGKRRHDRSVSSQTSWTLLRHL